MKLASMNWMRPEPIERTIARLAQAGYDSIEISGEPDRYPPDEVRRLLEKHRLECWGSVALMVAGRDLIGEKEEVRRASVQYCLDVVDLIAALGGRIFCIVPAEVGRRTPRAAPEQEWAWCVDGLKRINDRAREKKIRIGIEPINRFETNFINRHDQALALAAAAGPDVGVVLDSFHINIEERDPYAAILNVGPKLVDFQIADTNRWPPGRGHWDWVKLVGALKMAGYDGCLTNEFVIPADRTPCSEIRSMDPGRIDPDYAADLKFIENLGSAVPSEEQYAAAMRETVTFMRKLIG
jgi:sugar phosphate isomerase/epimerase